MAIYLPATADDEHIALDELTPREIVRELDKYVVGQNQAKRAVAIALRNRMRRQKLSAELAEEVIPKNIIMIGPTGVGKTEIARRLAKLANSPFMKVEASKFTEVGYVGRDVESMIRDLVEIAIDMVREEKLEDVADKAELNAEERLLDLLLPAMPAPVQMRPAAQDPQQIGFNMGGEPLLAGEPGSRTREKFRQQLREGKLDERIVELDVRENRCLPSSIITNQGDRGDGRQHERHVAQHLRPAHQEAEDEGQRGLRVPRSRKKSSACVDIDQVTRVAVERVERFGHHLPRRNRQDRRA